MKNYLIPALTIATLSAFSFSIQAKECMDIGGVAMPIFSPQPDGTIRITAPLMGSVVATSGTITKQIPTKTGLKLELNHYFLDSKGEAFHTEDNAVITNIPGKTDRYMIEINYDFEPGSARGTLEGYTGSFQSYGLVDMNKLEGLVRYNGNICKP